MKVFLLFLICSFLAWSVSKLSESYESRANFEIDYINFPDTLLLNTTDKQLIGAKLRTSGFQFLRLGISPRKIKLDLSEVVHNNESYYLSSNFIKPQLEKQLSNSFAVLELEKERLYVALYQVVSKEVPIEPNVTIDLAQNHLLEGKLEIEPQTILIKGPSNEVKTIEGIKTEPLVFSGLTNDFSGSVSLIKPEGLSNSQFSKNSVVISGNVVRFSEKEFIIPVKAINIPEGYRVRMFPDQVALICKAGVEVLKNFKNDDFEAVIDCSSSDDASNQLPIKLTKTPENIYGVRLLEEQIEFVLEKL